MKPTWILIAFIWTLARGEGKSSSSDCACGHVNNGMKSGGTVSPLLFPWMVSIVNAKSGSSFCGGVLINRNEVLTSARCVQPTTPSDISLILGVHDLGKAKARDRYRVTKIIPHEDFRRVTVTPTTYENDIALLVLEDEILLTPNMAPICLSKRMEESTEKVTVLGWGSQSSDGKHSTQRLQMLSLPMIKTQDCGIPWNRTFQASETICMGTPGHNICEGDQGGPLQTFDMYEPIQLVGIASSTGPTCGDRFPGLYSRFEHFRSWVKQKSQFYSQCYKD